MQHHDLESIPTVPNQRYAINVNCGKTHVLLQLDDGYRQTRVVLTKADTGRIVRALLKARKKIQPNDN